MARGRISGRHQHHATASRALARRDGPAAPLLFLPTRGYRDAHLVGRGRGRISAGNVCAGRWRALGAPLQQNGDRHRQDHGDGDDHHLAGLERPHLSETEQAFQPRGLHCCAGAHRQGSPSRALSRRGRQLLRRIRHLPVGESSPEAQPGRRYASRTGTRSWR
jgi:hypothetical protein